MAAVAETTDASAGDSVRTFLDTDCAVSTVFFGSQYKISAQFFLSQQNNLISCTACTFVKPLYLSLMRVLVVFYLWVNFVLVKRSPASKFTSQYLTYLNECFVSCCVFPYTFWRWASDLALRNFSAQASHLFPKNHPLNCSLLGVARVSHHQKVVHVQDFLC